MTEQKLNYAALGLIPVIDENERSILGHAMIMDGGATPVVELRCGDKWVPLRLRIRGSRPCYLVGSHNIDTARGWLL